MRPPIETTNHSFSTVRHLGENIGSNLDKLRYRPVYELTPTRLYINDPVWNEEVFEDEPYDQLFVDLAHTDAFRRLQTIEQLSLIDRYATIPDAANFSRWEHMWGSTIFQRRMAREIGLEPKESAYLQLKILLGDLKHTVGSHVGDWLFQGQGGAENAHEDRYDYAEIVGIVKLIERYGFDARRVFDDETEDMTNTPSPALDPDRVDYTLRESYRWVDQSPLFKQHLNADSFTLSDGKIVARNEAAAKLMAGSYALLVRGHWQDPVHRLQINLLLTSLQRVFVASEGARNEWGSYSPMDLMMTSDHDFMSKFREHDEYMHHIDAIMTEVAKSEREVHWQHRRNVARYMIEKTLGLNPKKITWMTDYYKTLPSSCEIERVPGQVKHFTDGSSRVAEGKRLRNSERMVVIPLPALRARLIDPPFVGEDGEIHKVSDSSPEFWAYLQRKLSDTRMKYSGGLVNNSHTTERIRACLEHNNRMWPEVMERPRLPSAAVRELLRSTVQVSLPHVADFMDMTVRT